MLQEYGLKIPCFDTSEDISSENPDSDGIRRLLEIAWNMHIPYVAVCALQDHEDRIRGFLKTILSFLSNIRGTSPRRIRMYIRQYEKDHVLLCETRGNTVQCHPQDAGLL